VIRYALCYFFYALRTYKDKHLAGPIEHMYASILITLVPFLN